MTLPGSVGLSDLRVYDWPAADGRCGGSPHMHLVCTEAYVVVEGSGAVQTLTWSGFAETPLEPGAVVSFTPGTIHRLVNGDGRLRIVVVMQNSGLPEAGDAVFTFPPDILSDPVRYGEAASPADVRGRRDLAMTGFTRLRELGRAAVEEFHEAALGIVAGRLDAFEERWLAGARAAADATGDQLAALRRGDVAHLRAAGVSTLSPTPRPGMCGDLLAY
ncbi:cupin domain-containing protein [Nonomuraea sp. NBC_01738]|uniref:cupin domain-containing protein n=1 Tax=Nonomuraea sp. NBC_01738 TaxID=2976003 RepID=UPI002E0D5C17|nr:cupin domain-containing protein [Nonomuraea sp. NBC_01738]